MPAILERKPGETIRVWSCGCASGEEAYTLVMVFAEALGEEEFKRRVKVYATAVDDDALQTARHATYPEEALVLWAWNPGRHPDGTARSLPPITHEQFVNATRLWVEAGMPCP